MTTAVPGLRDFEILEAFFDSPFTTDVELPSGVCVKGYFDAENVIGDDMRGPTVVLESRHVLERSVAHGDVLTIDGSDYRVEGIRPDGTGLTELIMVIV